MNPLIGALKEILDIDDLQLCESEAKSKLEETYMVLNGSVVKIYEFFPHANVIRISDENGQEEKLVETLEVFLPEVGVYFPTLIPTLLKKSPIKKWKKSFNFGLYTFQGAVSEAYVDQVYKFHKCTPVHLFDYKEAVYFDDKKVGKYNPFTSTVTCTNFDFYQELSDWIRDEREGWTLKP